MSAFTPVRELAVHRCLADGGRVSVGRLAQDTRHVYFEYDADYLNSGHSLSPFRLAWDTVATEQGVSQVTRGLIGKQLAATPTVNRALLADG